ncbi:MAG TPA: hypothetical protein QF572_08720 [Vicinamibacterales bacterium]|jgi:hypothetical protein|nr:hypothetical protein [Vicinamibacterales bacterium]HJN44243.1 hypothetical protein [Vicinamibacterales bacterium]|tara:strand:- start:848 stop:1399 length:552 start_codon:yes stop_codon:yes gene_type:complete
MTNSRVALLTGGGALLAAWLSSAAGVAPSTVRSDLPSGVAMTPAQAVTPASAPLDLTREVARLASRLEDAPRPRQPARNPFTLSSRMETSTTSKPAPLPPPAATPAVVERVAAAGPVVALVGIGAERTSYGRRRTAILSAEGHVVLAHIGDEVLGRFQVRAITDDAVDLLDLRDDTPLRLELP